VSTGVGSGGFQLGDYLTRPTATPDNQAGWQPPSSLPSKDAIGYWKELITVGLLFLALPYVVWKLITDPAGAMRKVAGKQALS
jgi:hypothetical protein